jgi:hypothetical protein
MKNSNNKTVILFGNDDWTKLIMGTWEVFQEDNFIRWKTVHVQTGRDFIDSINKNTYDGIILVFNPILLEMENIWTEFQKNSVYQCMPLLFLANTPGIRYCATYIRENIDMVIDFTKYDVVRITTVIDTYLSKLTKIC